MPFVAISKDRHGLLYALPFTQQLGAGNWTILTAAASHRYFARPRQTPHWFCFEHRAEGERFL
ncbi:hypothetical protein [Mesorhizobium sp.]|uniref:hypothetical protein n=1 Tax=Mesorhizobium sp. TaxID=1871066 RepID=UPI0025D97549|nr:hypothetical protein [Mesorhizobium sp.]